MTDRELDIVLNRVGELAKYKDAFQKMCRYYMSLYEGDVHYPEEAFELMRKFNVIDENDELICE
jgi:hypothetical protein